MGSYYAQCQSKYFYHCFYCRWSWGTDAILYSKFYIRTVKYPALWRGGCKCLATFLTVYLGLSLPVTIAFALISGFAVALGTLSALCADCIEMILKRRFVPLIIYLLLNAVFGLISAMLAIQTYALTGDIYAP